jgi:hypothetical protein
LLKVFILSVVLCYIVCCLIVVSVLFVCCLIVVPLPPGENPFAVNNNNKIINRPRCEADRSPPFSAVVKNGGTVYFHSPIPLHSIHLFIRSSMSLQPFVEPWPLLQFCSLFYRDGRTPCTGISPSQGRYLQTEQHKHRINTHKHSCLEWVSNPRSQLSRKRRQSMP